jgi:hypothetical protein
LEIIPDGASKRGFRVSLSFEDENPEAVNPYITIVGFKNKCLKALHDVNIEVDEDDDIAILESLKLKIGILTFNTSASGENVIDAFAITHQMEEE